MSDLQTHEQIVQSVLSRWSMQDLIEQSSEAIEAALTKYTGDANKSVVLERGTKNFIRWWKVGSGDKVYECRRFQNWVWCSCADFFYRKRVCRHLASSLHRCWDCFVLSATGGKLCKSCEAKAQLFVPAQSPLRASTSI